MNQDQSSIKSFFQEFFEIAAPPENCEAWIAPQFIHLPLCQSLAQNKLKIGAQNCSGEESGAFTGEVSAKSLKDLQADFVILGHSERRQIFKESHEVLNQKLHTSLKQGLKVIFCVGETLEERESGQTESVIKEQVLSGLAGTSAQDFSQILVAYEPVWAIGTGKTATPKEAQTTHAFIRTTLNEHWSKEAAQTPLLYGGSVKPENALELLLAPDIDGALVGGASLTGTSFSKLCSLVPGT